MRYLDVCAGISASTVAWATLGWRAAAYSEIEAAPRAILSHHYPETPLHGDFTTIAGDEYGPIDLLVGGTPCQDFSVAGLRAGLDGERGNLSLEFLRLADRARPRWLVWENVPGVLSIDGGRAFGAILGGLGQLGYGFAYRVLDAQHFGVPQRRRRVFVVGYLGDWRRAGAVLFERHSLSGHPAPRREAREGVADCAPHGPLCARRGAGRAADGRTWAQGFGGGANCQATDVATAVAAHPGGRYDFECETFVCGTLNASGKAAGSATQQDAENGMLITHALRGEGFDASEDGTGRGTPLVPVAFTSKDHGQDAGDIAPTLRAMQGGHANAGGQVAVAFTQNSRSEVRAIGGDGGIVGALAADGGAQQQNYVAFDMRGREGGAQFEGPHETANLRAASGGSSRSYVAASAVRRLTPRECERLQGFPDDYTLVPYRRGMMANGPRYKALGNSMAVPVMRWIGERIAAVEAIGAEALAV